MRFILWEKWLKNGRFSPYQSGINPDLFSDGGKMTPLLTFKFNNTWRKS